jgi:hypothetical protein
VLVLGLGVGAGYMDCPSVHTSCCGVLCRAVVAMALSSKWAVWAACDGLLRHCQRSSSLFDSCPGGDICTFDLICGGGGLLESGFNRSPACLSGIAGVMECLWHCTRAVHCRMWARQETPDLLVLLDIFWPKHT